MNAATPAPKPRPTPAKSALPCPTCAGTEYVGHDLCGACRGTGAVLCDCCRYPRATDAAPHGESRAVPAVVTVDDGESQIPLCRACLGRDLADVETAYEPVRAEWSANLRSLTATQAQRDAAYKRMVDAWEERRVLREVVSEVDRVAASAGRAA